MNGQRDKESPLNMSRTGSMSEEEGIFQLTNYRDHPTNNLYKVFFFREEQRAHYFEGLLKEKNIPFERDTEEYKKSPLYLYGIRKTHLSEALDCNFLTMAKFRKPLLGANKWFRYGLILISLLLLVLAAIGYSLSE